MYAICLTIVANINVHKESTMNYEDDLISMVKYNITNVKIMPNF
jgi:hypothetical protein